MNWRYVLQPDGLLALFSDEEHDFTDYALTEEDALAGCIRIGMEPEAARCMVDETFRDLCHISGKPLGPLGRWNEWSSPHTRG